MSRTKKITDDDLEDGQLEESVLPPDNIVVLNELRSASDLTRLMADDESINIRPDFQRDEVWTCDARARFIDSLSKEFPIPSMCLALDPKKQKFIVIDGLQRMSTIKLFFTNDDWQLPTLQDISKKISGKSVKEIKKFSPEIFRKIENISLPVTILRYDPERKDNMDYIYTIFQRINTFGERLKPQEIRNAIYQGPFNTFIRNCAKNKDWESIVRIEGARNKNRMMAEESVLRFFAFFEKYNEYNGKLNKFLNDYTREKRYIVDNQVLENVFYSTITIVKKIKLENIGKSNAIRDAIFFGVATNIKHLLNKKSAGLQSLVNKIKNNENFNQDTLLEGTMKQDKVTKRLSIAKEIFAE